MGKYRKKPVVIEAEQWDTYSHVEGVRITHNLPDNSRCGYCLDKLPNHGWITTLEGGYIVCPGDWIITGVKGEKYPCKPDIFDATYDRVEEGN